MKQTREILFERLQEAFAFRGKPEKEFWILYAKWRNVVERPRKVKMWSDLSKREKC